MRKIIFIVASLFVSASISAQTLATFEDGAGDILSIDASYWYDGALFTQKPAILANPDATGINTSSKCFGATNVADASWWGNFESLKLSSPVTIDNTNRILSFMAYRSIQPKNMRIGFNDRDHSAWDGMVAENAKWQNVNIDLGNSYMGQSLSAIAIIFSTNWDEPKSGWGVASYCFDNFKLSPATVLDQSVAYTAPTTATSAAFVSLKRTVTKSRWNTLCLPFSLTAAQVQSVFGSGTKIADYTGFDGTSISFTTSTTGTITANTPCLIIPTNESGNYVFPDVTIAAASDNTVSKSYNGETVSFIGTYAPISNLYTEVGSTGTGYVLQTLKLYKADAASTVSVNGFRAYFKDSGASGAKVSVTVDGDVTAIQDMNMDNTDNNSTVYDMSGRLLYKNVPTQSLKKGMYIVNGKKLLVK